MNGYDISSYQGEPDFDALKSAADFVFIKATEGIGFTDPQLARSQAEARRVGLRLGYYHFCRPDAGLSPLAEATYFTDRIGALAPGELVALDFEVGYPNPVPWCKAWLELVRERTGAIPFLYLNQSEVRENDWRPVWKAGYPLWLADYDGDPTSLPDLGWGGVVAIKQFSDAGTAARVHGNVDVDAAEVDLAQYGKGGDMDQDKFDAMFLAAYQKYGVADLFEVLKKIDTNLNGRIVALEAHAGIDAAAQVAELAAHQQAQDAALTGLASAIAAVNNQVIATRDALHNA